MGAPSNHVISKYHTAIAFLKRNPALAVSTAVVWASSFVLPYYPTGYGTVLSLNVRLWGWGLVSEITSGRFADHNFLPVIIMTSIVNTLAFLLPALPTYLVAKTRSGGLAATLVICVLVFYLAFLFFLFPATDGP